MARDGERHELAIVLVVFHPGDGVSSFRIL
jgi:hypothetical protein